MSEAPPPSRLPNREHYLKAALAGGGVGALLSVLPGLNTLNLFFGMLIMGGGGMAAYLVQKKAIRRIGLGEAMFVGALAGLFTGMVLTGLSIVLGVPLWLIVMDEARRSKKGKLFVLGMMFFGGSCGATLTIYPMLGAFGGLFSGLVNEPSPKMLAAAGEAGEVSAPPPPTEEELAKRKKIKKIVLGSCLGCLGLMALAFAGFTYLIYLQSRDPEDTAGYDEVASATITIGERGEIRLPAVADGAGRYAIWLVDDEPIEPFIDLEGRLGCEAVSFIRPGASPRLRRLFTYRPPDSSHPNWYYLDSEYGWSGREIVCNFEIDGPAEMNGARIVVVRLTRPFD